jgi:hypothetical protein
MERDGGAPAPAPTARAAEVSSPTAHRPPRQSPARPHRPPAYAAARRQTRYARPVTVLAAAAEGGEVAAAEAAVGPPQ